MFRKMQSLTNKDPLASLMKKLTNLVEAIGESQISAEPYELPELRELQSSITHCNTLAKDKEPYTDCLKEALGTISAIREYFTAKASAMQIMSALTHLEDEIKELLPKDQPKAR